LCEVLNMVLKQIIKEPRPAAAFALGRTGYGMPSDHAQFMFFFATYCCLFVYFDATFEDKIWKHFAALAVYALACIVSYSRLYFELHTVLQVAVGAVMGGVFACLWFILLKVIFGHLFPVIAEWRLSKYCYIKDSRHIPNIRQFEYEASRKYKQKKN